jgi:hypothetical protein
MTLAALQFEYKKFKSFLQYKPFLADIQKVKDPLPTEGETIL